MQKGKIIKWVLAILFLAGLDTYLLLHDWKVDSSLFALFVFWAAFGVLIGYLVAKRTKKLWLGIICGIVSFIPFYFLNGTKAGMVFGVVFMILVSNVIILFLLGKEN